MTMNGMYSANEDEEKVNAFASLLFGFQTVKDDSLKCLSELDDRFEAIENKTKTLLKQTESIKVCCIPYFLRIYYCCFQLQHANVGKTQARLNAEIAKYDVPESITQPLKISFFFINCTFLPTSVLEPQVGPQLITFLKLLTEAFEERDKLKQHSKYTGIYNLAMQTWSGTIKAACDYLLSLYEPCVELYVADVPYDRTIYEYKFPDNEHFKQLRQIQQFLDREGRKNYIDLFVNLRQKHVSLESKSLNVEAVNAAAKEATTIESYYPLGSHPIIPLINRILSLMLYERGLLDKCLTFNPRSYEAIATPVATIINNTVSSVLNRNIRKVEHDFLVLDILTAILKYRKSFADTMGAAGVGGPPLKQLSETLITAANYVTFARTASLLLITTLFSLLLLSPFPLLPPSETR